MGNFDIILILKYLPGIILGLTVHEYCHALMAQWCGDNTSRDQGRVTLNPLKHIDPFGFIILSFMVLSDKYSPQKSADRQQIQSDKNTFGI